MYIVLFAKHKVKKTTDMDHSASIMDGSKEDVREKASSRDAAHPKVAHVFMWCKKNRRISHFKRNILYYITVWFLHVNKVQSTNRCEGVGGTARVKEICYRDAFYKKT